MDRFEHIMFFNEHTQYSQRQLIRRFNIIVNDWIVNESKKKALQKGYDKWKENPNEVNKFWAEWSLKKAIKNRINAPISEASTSSVTVAETETIASTLSNSTNELLKNYLSSYITAPNCKPYMIDSVNVSQCFYDFQTVVKETITNGNTLTFERHLVHILSVSSILLLCRQTNDPDLDGHLNGLSSVIIKDLLSQLEWGTSRFPRELIITLMDIYRDLTTDKYDIDAAVAKIVSLSVDTEPIFQRSRQPDGSISLNAGPINKHLGYIEIKPFSTAKNHYKVNVDLTRLVIFRKNAIDSYHSQNIMVIQAVGMNLTFYMIQRTTEELYTMFELEHIRFPSSIDEMTMMFVRMDKMMNIVQTFRKYCLATNLPHAEVSKGSLKSPILQAITSATVSRKRKNHHQHNHF
ncbi:uncharacterized protein BX663DRAFT_551989 [Cokeromyces recurvatus]|uniref:uncharacterized protein n=1 Tax=Cokeromyces recurvatus TaxID=90255 RepID=UPI00221E66C8|nr:uncharacterized protein BX663DRAFT_551989 [Cokeromyces recurvatus]KAI7902578.1 hypothetical protein BX663DRAFT_551989 [Cokeromyces recurvatus]